MDTRTSEYYITYFDILGYKAFFEDNENDIQEFLQSNLAIAQDTADITRNCETIARSLKYKMFSDNCIIMIQAREAGEEKTISYLLELMASLQLKFLKDYRIPIRGAITKGQAFINDDIVFGSGLIEAVRMEGEDAVYPRIVVDEEIARRAETGKNKRLIKKDHDGQYYVDFFSLMVVRDIFFPDKKVKSDICKTRDQIFELAKRYCHYDGRVTDFKKIQATEKTILKYLWLLSRFNEYAEELGIPARIEYKISINKTVMRFEIVDLKKWSWPIAAN